MLDIVFFFFTPRVYIYIHLHNFSLLWISKRELCRFCWPITYCGTTWWRDSFLYFMRDRSQVENAYEKFWMSRFCKWKDDTVINYLLSFYFLRNIFNNVKRIINIIKLLARFIIRIRWTIFFLHDDTKTFLHIIYVIIISDYGINFGEIYFTDVSRSIKFC